MRHKFFSEDVRKEKGVDEGDSVGGGGRYRKDCSRSLSPLSLSLSAPLRKLFHATKRPFVFALVSYNTKA